LQLAIKVSFRLFLAFYVQSILYNAERSIAAFRRFDIAVEGLIVSTVQEALTHAGALSRFFWPVKKGDSLATARGERLRELFSLSEASPLKSRKLRNAFEHFDEDLDRFLLYDRFGYLFPGPLVDDHTLADEVIGTFSSWSIQCTEYACYSAKNSSFYPYVARSSVS
jgi:hypothetical protein